MVYRFDEASKALPVRLRAAVFFLGAVTQIVKLLALEGVWTQQIWALCWIASFVIFAAVAWAASSRFRTFYPHDDNRLTKERRANFAERRNIIITITICFYTLLLMSIVFQPEIHGEWSPWSIWQAVLVFLGQTLLFISLLIVVQDADGSPALFSGAVVFVCMVAGYWFVIHFTRMGAAQGFLKPLGHHVLLIVVVTALLAMLGVLASYFIRKFKISWEKIKSPAVFCLFAVYTLAPLIFYSCFYNPEGTVKPSSTEQLG
jgi:hypothetical protein